MIAKAHRNTRKHKGKRSATPIQFSKESLTILEITKAILGQTYRFQVEQGLKLKHEQDADLIEAKRAMAN